MKAVLANVQAECSRENVCLFFDIFLTWYFALLHIFCTCFFIKKSIVHVDSWVTCRRLGSNELISHPNIQDFDDKFSFVLIKFQIEGYYTSIS